MNTKTTAVAVQDEPVVGPVTRMMKRVIIQRPSGNTDDGIFLGFNSFEGNFPFDKAIELPADMVDYMRTQKRCEFRPGERGQPIASYTNLINIVDAPQYEAIEQ